ncbi:response regulator [Aurantibacter sp.]|uniref:response regulator n=1 Tax=Aurantibacter sp. TaxID=2807103 RepID=UPI0032657711
MNRKKRILIVEDDMIIGANISMQLINLGYEVDGLVARGEDAIAHAANNIPDLLLLDINLKGVLNGIETAERINQLYNIPIIYLTANSDDVTFKKAKDTFPKAFITKPFNKLNLQRTISLVFADVNEVSKKSSESNLEVLEDRIFVRHYGKMEKLMLKDILFIEADRNYSNIITKSGKFLLTSTLKSMEGKLPANQFLRVHRSFIVNVTNLDVVAEDYLEINRKVIPLSKSHKELLMGRIRTV